MDVDQELRGKLWPWFQRVAMMVSIWLVVCVFMLTIRTGFYGGGGFADAVAAADAAGAGAGEKVGRLGAVAAAGRQRLHQLGQRHFALRIPALATIPNGSSLVYVE